MGSVPLAGSETHSPSLSLFVSNGAARSPEVVEGEPHWGETCAGIRKGRSANERGTTGQLERSGEVVSGPAGVEPIPVGGRGGLRARENNAISQRRKCSYACFCTKLLSSEEC